MTSEAKEKITLDKTQTKWKWSSEVRMPDMVLQMHWMSPEEAEDSRGRHHELCRSNWQKNCQRQRQMERFNGRLQLAMDGQGWLMVDAWAINLTSRYIPPSLSVFIWHGGHVRMQCTVKLSRNLTRQCMAICMVNSLLY